MNNEILNVVIIDDEYFIRELLKTCIDWADLGLRIVGDFENAQEALEFVEIDNPDIILTDICMPFMDGLELSRIVAEQFPFIKIVILTGHDEFEYAQRSIKVGVSDFLLKPINDQEIRVVLAALREKIIGERDHRNEHQQIKKQLEENLPYLKERFLNELLMASGGTEVDLANKLKYYRIEFPSPFFQVAVLQIHDSENESDNEEEKHLVRIMQSLEFVKQYFSGNASVHCCLNYHQHIILLSNDPALNLTEACERLKILALKRLNIDFCVGVGQQYAEIKSLSKSYKEACYALKFKIVAGKNQVIHFNDINFSGETFEWGFQSEQAELLELYLESGLEDRAKEIIESVCNKLNQVPGVTLVRIRVTAADIVSLILNILTKTGIHFNNVFSEQVQPYEKVFIIDTLPEIKEYLNHLVDLTAKAIRQMQNKKVSKIINEIQDYIFKNYQQSDLSLSGAAQTFFLNPSYLSRIFKQGTGLTFVEFLTKIRMEKAIKLLNETDLKVYQIGERVGINDPHYFSICFKKYHGMSVLDYRKNN